MKKTQKASVIFFDKSSGEGMIRVEDGTTSFIYACDIPGKKTWYPHTACIFYEKNQSIEVWYDDGIHQYRCVTRGTIDTEVINEVNTLWNTERYALGLL